MTENQKLPQWDLTREFGYTSYTDPKIEQDLVNMEAAYNAFKEKHAGKIAGYSGDELAAAYKEKEALVKEYYKPAKYTELYYLTDMNSTEKYNAAVAADSISNDIKAARMFFYSEIAALSKDELDKKFAESTELQKYKPVVNEVRRLKGYYTPEGIEATKSFETAYKALEAGKNGWMYGLKFRVGGEEIDINGLQEHLFSPDEATRKEASLAMAHTLKDNMEAPIEWIKKAIEINKEYAQKTGFAGIFEKVHADNNLEPELTSAMQQTIRNNYENTTQRFYRIKAILMGKTRLDNWDNNAPYPGPAIKEATKISWEEAKEFAIAAYEHSPEMQKRVKEYFDNGWIDAVGKPTQCVPGPVHSYISMNYTGTTHDVLNLVHELGHAVQNDLIVNALPSDAIEKLTPVNAEMSSTTAEEFASRKMLEKIKTPEEKIKFLYNRIKLNLDTINVQTCYSVFEAKAHEFAAKGEITAATMRKAFINVNNEMNGDSVHPSILKDEEAKGNGWSLIPHFLTPGYVSSYAIGKVTAISTVVGYDKAEDKKHFADEQIKVLQAGSTKHHTELLAPLGISLADKDITQKALDIIIRDIDELEKLVGKGKGPGRDK